MTILANRLLILLYLMSKARNIFIDGKALTMQTN